MKPKIDSDFIILHHLAITSDFTIKSNKTYKAR